MPMAAADESSLSVLTEVIRSPSSHLHYAAHWAMMYEAEDLEPSRDRDHFKLTTCWMRQFGDKSGCLEFISLIFHSGFLFHLSSCSSPELVTLGYQTRIWQHNPTSRKETF